MTKTSKLYTISIVFVLISVAVFWISSYLGYTDYKDAAAVTVSGFITSFNFILGVLAINFGMRRSDQIFMGVFFGGMILRLIILLSAVLISLTVLELKENSFIFSIFFFYILYLIAEVLLLIFKRH